MESLLRCIQILKTHQVNSLILSPDGKTLISSDKNTTKVWDVNTGESKKSFTGLKNIVLSPDQKTLAGTQGHYFDNSIQLWDLSTGNLKSTITESCQAITLSPDGQTLAILKNQGILLWDIETNQPIKTLSRDIPNSGSSIAFSADGKTLFSECDYTAEYSTASLWIDGNIRSCYIQHWDIETDQLIRKSRDKHVAGVAPDGQFLLALKDRSVSISSRDRDTIDVIDIQTGESIKSFVGTTAAFSQDGKVLAINEENKSLKLLNWPSETDITTLPGPLSCFALSEDGKTLALAYGDTIKIWQEGTEAIVEQFFHGDAHPHLKRLENLLAAELWDDADQETASILEGFPSQDVNLIDQLWIHYSHGDYGFSVQKSIWESILDNKNIRYKRNGRPVTDIDEFECRVGWLDIKSDPFIDHDNDEYFEIAYRKAKKGYYPRIVHPSENLEILSRLS